MVVNQKGLKKKKKQKTVGILQLLRDLVRPSGDLLASTNNWDTGLQEVKYFHAIEVLISSPYLLEDMG